MPRLTNVTVDIETYFDTHYTIRKLPTVLYVRDPRFQLLGLSAKVDHEPSYWVHPDDMDHWVRQFQWDRVQFIAHNTQFDALALREHYGITPARYCDTMALTRLVYPGHLANLDTALQREGRGGKSEGLGDVKGLRLEDIDPYTYGRLIRYGLIDNEGCYFLYQEYASRVPASQLDFVHMITRMSVEPQLEIDLERARKGLMDAKAERERIIRASGLDAKTLGSDAKFAKALREMGIDVPMKWSAKQKKPIPALAKGDLQYAELKRQRTDLRHVWEGREAANSTNDVTRIERLIAIGETGKLGVPYNVSGAHTHRLSGRDKINLQNMKRGSEARKSIRAPVGSVLMVYDASQIECRMLNTMAGQDDIVQVFRNRGDVYSLMASRIYGRDIRRKEREEDVLPGFVGKVAELGLGYEMWIYRFQATMASGAMGGPPMFFTLDECRDIVLAYRDSHTKVVDYWGFLQKRLWDMVTEDNRPRSGFFASSAPPSPAKYKCLTFEPERIRLPNGNYLYYPNLRQQNGSFIYTVDGRDKKIYGGLVAENTTQAIANVFIQECMLTIDPHYPVVMQSHDEIICLVRKKDVERASEFIETTMSTPPKWLPDLPVACEGGWAEEYSK